MPDQETKPTRPLTARQKQALRLCAREFVSWYTGKSIPSLVKRGLVIDHGRYHESRGHPRRYVVSAAGHEMIRDMT